MRVEPVCGVLDALGVQYALIGAHAMAARGYPRFTTDVDLLTTDRRVLEPGTFRALQTAGASVDQRTGDAEDPLGGVVHILLPDETDVDIVVGKWKWEADVVDRAEVVDIAQGVRLRVPTTSDLILLKLAAGGFADLQDAAALLVIAGREIVVPEIESRLDEVRPDVRGVWKELLARTA